MKGVSYITNENNKMIAVQIEIEAIKKFQDDVEDLLDGIIAESRKGEKKTSLSKVISNLKKLGKLK